MSARVAASFLTSLSLLLASPVQAGSWSSGGGEILEQARNPWFLNGPGAPTRVTYCVAKGVDFPIAEERLSTLVKSAIDWWGSQFGDAFAPVNTYWDGTHNVNAQVFVKTTGFVEVACSATPDLAFQFGYLTPDQEAEFQRQAIDLTRYVALTIRTDYDEHLHGRGFIYVSPDRGSKAFRGQNILSEAWTEGDQGAYRLRSVVMHELGHVFGLTHSDANDSIMSAKMAEEMVSKISANSDQYIFGLLSQNIFFPKVNRFIWEEYCKSRGDFSQFRRYFAVPDEVACFRINYSLNGFSIDGVLDEHDNHWQQLGMARFPDGGQRRHRQLVTVWLPANQSAFPGIPSNVSSLLGPASTEVQQTGIYQVDGTSIEKPIFVQASPRYFQVGGVIDQNIVPDLLPVSGDGRSVSGWSDQ